MALPDLRKEASDPDSDPERLRKLVDHEDEDVRQAAWRNPSLPEDVWRKALMHGMPEAWANPMALIYVFAWTPQKEDAFDTLDHPARWSMSTLWKNPERCSSEGKALLAAKVQTWWSSSESSVHMMSYLGWWVEAKGKDSPEHREAVRLLILCVRTAPNLSDKDRQVLERLEAWSAGGEDRRDEAEGLASSEAVNEACRFAQDPSHDPADAILDTQVTVLADQNGTNRLRKEAEHERLLTDMIRQAMPLPPVLL